MGSRTFRGVWTAWISYGRPFFFKLRSIARLMRRSLLIETPQTSGQAEQEDPVPLELRTARLRETGRSPLTLTGLALPPATSARGPC